MHKSKGRFRQGIVAVIINERGQVLMAERSDYPGNWQFPQGGIDGDETPEQALYREVQEELGNGEISILKTGQGKSQYRWPEAGKKHVGQEHTWFLVEFNKNEKPNLKKSDGCFQDWKWEVPELVLAQIYDWKRPAYATGLQLLGLKRDE